MTSIEEPANQVSLASTTVGDDANPPVLMIHGFTGSADDWRGLANHLASDYYVILVDLPGHGQTRIDDPKFYTMGYTASLIVKVLETLAIERCDMVAYSMGGRLGLFLLSQFPQRFRRAVLESTSPGLDSEQERTTRRKHDEALAASLTQTGLRVFLDNWYKQPIFEAMRRHSDRMAALIERRHGNDPRGLATSLRMMGTGVQPNLWPELANIAHPILFITGEYDDKFVDIAGRMADLCPAAKVRTIADSGHNVHFEQPAAFHDAVKSFLARNA